MKQELRSANFQQLPSLLQPSVTLFFFATWKLPTLIGGWHKFLARDENCRQTTPRFTHEWQGSVIAVCTFWNWYWCPGRGEVTPCHTPNTCFSKTLCISWNQYSCDRQISNVVYVFAGSKACLQSPAIVEDKDKQWSQWERQQLHSFFLLFLW